MHAKQNKKTATTQIFGIATAVISVIFANIRCAYGNICISNFMQVSRLAHPKAVRQSTVSHICFNLPVLPVIGFRPKKFRFRAYGSGPLAFRHALRKRNRN
jgi:hypothetical protein